jgi:hypothetical protein
LDRPRIASSEQTSGVEALRGISLSEMKSNDGNRFGIISL